MDNFSESCARESKIRKIHNHTSLGRDKVPLRQVNPAIVELIAEFIPPNPIIYLRLACVSRSFQKVFTSDKKWKFLDPHSYGSPIAAQFSRRSRELDLVQMSQLILVWTSARGWADPENSDFWFTYEAPKGRRAVQFSKFLTSESIHANPNLDITLGYLARCHAVKDPEKSTRISANFQLAYCALNLNANALYHLHPKWRLDLDLVRAAANTGYFKIDLINKNLWRDPLVLRGLSRYRSNLEPLCKGLSVDLQLAVLGFNGEALIYLSDTLKDNFDIVMAAIHNSPTAYAFASTRLQANKDIVLKAVSFNYEFFEAESFRNKDKASFCHTHISFLESWLSFIPAHLLQDEEVIDTFLDANNGLLPCSYTGLEYLELGRRALRRDVRNFWRVPPSLVTREILLQALSKSYSFERKELLPGVLFQQFSDPEVVQKALASLSFYVPLDTLEWSDEAACLAGIGAVAGVFCFVDDVLKSDASFVEKAIEANTACKGLALGFAALQSSKDVETLCHALRDGSITYSHLEELGVLDEFKMLMRRNNAVSLSAVHGCCWFWPYLSYDQASDFEHQDSMLTGEHTGGIEEFLEEIMNTEPSLPDLVKLTTKFPPLYSHLPPHLQAHPAMLQAIKAEPLMG